MRNYFFYNTDADSLVAAPRPRYNDLIARHYAASGGPYRFGEKLGKLSPGDILLMYENDIGVVAVGTVLERWDGQSHEEMWYYRHGENCRDEPGRDREYRIKVDWRRTRRAISPRELKDRIRYQVRGTVQRVETKRSEVEKIIVEF